jgi:hypothetical protein
MRQKIYGLNSIGRVVNIGNDFYRVAAGSFNTSFNGVALTTDPRISFANSYQETTVVQKATGSLPVPTSEPIRWETIADLRKLYNREEIMQGLKDQGFPESVESSNLSLIRKILTAAV